MTRRSALRSATAAALVVCIVAVCPAFAAAPAPQNSAETGIFATDTPALAQDGRKPADAAAVVDGHAIPLKDVIALCLRDDRSYVVDRMVQNYVVDRECVRRGIVVTDAEIDKDVDNLRKAVAPTPLDQVIATHHSTMADVRYAFKQKAERTRLVEDQVKPAKMVHCRAIVIKFSPPGMPEAVSGAKRTQAEAEALADDILGQIRHGKDFADLADHYSEAAPKNAKGDIGVLYDGMRDRDTWVVHAALSLGKGGVYPAAVKTPDSYTLIEGVSTNEDHPKAEDAAYADAFDAYRDHQAQFLSPKLVVDLIAQSQKTYCLDADALAQAGKPLPDAAAVIDGHVIPMKDVVAKCLADDGPHAVDVLVQNYLVDRECQRRGIIVSDAQIDDRVDNLRKLIAPHTLDEGLAYRHLTMDALRYDFKQEIERTRLVEDQVKPANMTHCRAIVIRYAPPGQDQPAGGIQPASDTQPVGETSSGGARRTEAAAQALMTGIQSQLKQGKDFGDLAAQYSEMGPRTDRGDIGVLYPAMRDMDTALLDAGLSLTKGGITAQPVKIVGGYALIQAVSTSDDHPGSEDALYSGALSAYKVQQASPLIPQAIVSLIQKSKVEYYVHA